MSALDPVHTPSGFGRVWEVASDFTIAAALIWAVPLLLGLVMALVGLFRNG